MKVVVFGPDREVGVWVGDHIVNPHTVDPVLPVTLSGLIEGGERVLDGVRAAVERAISGAAPHAVLGIHQTQLHAPAVSRPRIGCAAGNYAKHIAGTARRKGVAATASLTGVSVEGSVPSADVIVQLTRARDDPRGFWKDCANPVGPGGTITYPARAEQLDYEGEVVAIIGRTAKDVEAGAGAGYIWGVSLMNDWSIRGDSPRARLSFNLSKNFDGSASLGPCIVVGDLDPAKVAVQTRVNGELRQDYHSGDMIFSHAEYIEYLSRDFTLMPGDMIAGGSGPGSATDSDGRFLQPGDVVEVSAPEVGVLRNTVVAK